MWYDNRVGHQAVVKPSKFFVLDNCLVGIEVEQEGAILPPVNDYWREEYDGSLRGRSRELVLAEPLKGGQLKQAIEVLHNSHEALTPILDRVFSSRCSTHIHIDANDLSDDQFRMFLLITATFEPLISVIAETKNRIGSNFCRPLSESYKILSEISRYLHSPLNNSGDWFRINTSKYTTVNYAAIDKFGSIEFRVFQGEVDKDIISLWVNTLLSMKRYSILNPYSMGHNYVYNLMNQPQVILQAVFPGLCYELSDIFNADVYSKCAINLTRLM